MATDRHFICTNQECGKQIWIPRLFDGLLDNSQNRIQECPDCNNAMEIHLKMPFGLGVGDYHCRVIDVFTLSSTCDWVDDSGNKVFFYPFLVVTESESNKSAWLPYWHILEKDGKRTSTKYGQWAPFMDIELFNDLLKQASNKGHLL